MVGSLVVAFAGEMDAIQILDPPFAGQESLENDEFC